MKIYVVYKVNDNRWNRKVTVTHMVAYKTREEAEKGMRSLFPADMMCDNGYLIKECDLL